MTHDILQTDIDLAARLISEARPDEEVIAALVHRRVDPAKAAQLVDDLRNGRRTAIQPAAPPEYTAMRRSKSRSTEREAEPNGAAPPPESRPRRKTHSKSNGRGNNSAALTRLILVLVVVLGVAAVGIALVLRSRSNDSASTGQAAAAARKDASRPVASEPATARARVSPRTGSGLAFELQPEGLRVGGSPVTAQNVRAVVASLLGTPTRTNQIAKTGTTVYAYDSQGLLVYLPSTGGTNSIVLDCEGTGGTNGTTSAFAGSLTVEGRLISPNIGPQELAGIEKLGLDRSKTGSGIWSGRYHNVDLVFAYLRSPDRLSLIEIDLK